MKKLLKHTLVICAVALVSACSTDMKDLEQFVESTKSKFQGSVAPLPQFKPLVIYNAVKPSRDPFSSLSAEVREEKSTSQSITTITRPREPLELFPIDSLTMVGTLTGKDGINWALINDSQGTLHRVKSGSYIGQKQGQITSISDSHILVTELVLDANGLWTDKIIEIQLAE